MSNKSAGFPEHSAVRQSDVLELARPPFDTLTITLHWMTLLLVLAMVGTGLLYGRMEDRPWAPSLLSAHRSLGVIIWMITVVRLSWRLKGARIPGLPTSTTRPHGFAARLSEYGLYVLLLTQPLTGLAQTVSRGARFELLAWTIPSVVSKHFGYMVLFYAVHKLGAWCLIGLVSLHASAALFHHFIRRDDVLETMAPILRRKRELDPAATAIDVRSAILYAAKPLDPRSHPQSD
ncbi:MAG: cytochrome [Gammaproteobacteria bacterium]|jgi:superoxide oxidase|nr:cytochrome [Gammaproteobacteria bacterium]